MSDNIPTAEELLVLQCKGKVDLISWDNTIIFAKNLASFYVEAALKTASEKAEGYTIGKESGEGVIIDKRTILNAYPKENIK